MKLKIISNGTYLGTKVVNAETGERLVNVSAVHIDVQHTPEGPVVAGTFTIIGVQMDLDVDLEGQIRYHSSVPSLEVAKEQTDGT